jgi:hypothetical protein
VADHPHPLSVQRNCMQHPVTSNANQRMTADDSIIIIVIIIIIIIINNNNNHTIPAGEAEGAHVSEGVAPGAAGLARLGRSPLRLGDPQSLPQWRWRSRSQPETVTNYISIYSLVKWRQRAKATQDGGTRTPTPIALIPQTAHDPNHPKFQSIPCPPRPSSPPGPPPAPAAPAAEAGPRARGRRPWPPPPRSRSSPGTPSADKMTG